MSVCFSLCLSIGCLCACPSVHLQGGKEEGGKEEGGKEEGGKEEGGKEEGGKEGGREGGREEGGKEEGGKEEGGREGFSRMNRGVALFVPWILALLELGGEVRETKQLVLG